MADMVGIQSKSEAVASRGRDSNESLSELSCLHVPQAVVNGCKVARSVSFSDMHHVDVRTIVRTL